MRDSDTFLELIEEGEVKGLRRTVLRQGKIRFGQPDAATVRVVEAIDDIQRLEALTERLLGVQSWEELLA